MSDKIRIVSWNIRAGGGRRAEGILAQLLQWRPNIICLNEFRGTPASQWLADSLSEAGYGYQLSTINSKAPAKNALLLASQFPLQQLSLANMPKNPERWLLASIDTSSAITLGLMHVPNYTTPRLKYPYLNSVLRLARAWHSGPGLLLGDSNCGKRSIDEEKPSPPRFQREHEWIVGMEKRGWADSFRHLHGDRREYSWYSHRNNGFRLDYAFACPRLAPALGLARHVWGISDEEPGRREGLSDHAALLLELDAGKIEHVG